MSLAVLHYLDRYLCLLLESLPLFLAHVKVLKETLHLFGKWKTSIMCQK